jgi:uncharacterized protein (DUF2225 family)
MAEKPVIWHKKETCPLCRTEFETENVWLNRVKFECVYTDSAKKYTSVNPLFYEVWVCPDCLYASYRKEAFTNIKDFDVEKFETLAPICKKIAEGLDFHSKRDFNLACASFKLGLVALQARRKVSAARYAMFFMRLAWLNRGVNEEEEKKYMKLALSRYIEANEKETSPEIGSMGETGLYYTIGELYRRTGEVRQALEYYGKVIMDKNMAGDPSFIRKSRDQFDNCKEGLMVDVFPS